MRRLIPLLWLGVVLVLIGGPSAVRGAQQAGAQDPQAQQMSDVPAAVVVLPGQEALDAALRITKVADRLAALEKVRKDFPQSPLQNTVDGQVLAAVLEMPDATDSASEVLDRILARIPANATADARFEATVGPVARLVTRKVLLDRAEKLLADMVAAPTLASQQRARSRFELGRVFAARGDTSRAEAEYKAASREWAPAVAALVNFYVDRGEKPNAEAFLLDVVKATPVNLAALNSLVGLYKAEPARAEGVLKDAVGRDPRLPTALLSLAKLEEQRGDERSALDHYMRAAAMSYLRGADADAMKALYGKLNGSADGLEPGINALFVALPKPMKPAPYQPTARRTDRLVVLEMFTGSACPPCVAADIAFEAALDRYPATAIVPLAYHQHIPGPDPMTTTEGNARRLFYSVNGVPTMEIDGVMVASPDGGTFGGGGRDRAPIVSEKYNGLIDAALDTTAEAAVGVRATIAGDKVTVTADVSKLPAGAAVLRLHLVLAERELLFGGENGMRLHPMVVRGVAGEKGQGLPLAGTGTTQHVFDLAAIRADITRSLAADIGRRRGSGSSSSTFAAEDRAMTHIDPAHLVVVAFVQAPNKKILQASSGEVKR